MKSFRHSADERNSTKILKLRMKLGAAGYGVYMMLLERLAAEPDLRAELDYEVLAYDFHVEADFIRRVVEDFDLFVIDIEAETFSHTGLMSQMSPKAKREFKEKQIDEFIRKRVNNENWLENIEHNYNLPPQQVRGILQSHFRAEILENYSQIPNSDTLTQLFAHYLTDLQEKKEPGAVPNSF